MGTKKSVTERAVKTLRKGENAYGRERERQRGRLHFVGGMNFLPPQMEINDQTRWIKMKQQEEKKKTDRERGSECRR